MRREAGSRRARRDASKTRSSGLLTRSGKAERRSITLRTSPMTGAGGFAMQSGSERRAKRRNVERCRKCQARLWFGPKPSGGLSDEAICAGLVGAANLKIAAPSGGRANRPYQNVRTVARTEDVTLTRHGYDGNNMHEWICNTVVQNTCFTF